MAITAVQAVRAYSQRTFTSNGARIMPANKTIDREPTEAKLDLSNELRDEDLERVIGGKLSDLPVGHMTIKVSPEYTKS
jgi:hypothetical protein